VENRKTGSEASEGSEKLTIVAANQADAVKRACGEDACFVGEVVRGKGRCVL